MAGIPAVTAEAGYSVAPVTDFGISSTGGPPFEFLAVVAQITVATPGAYTVGAFLRTLDDTAFVAQCSDQAVTDSQQVTLYCSGMDIRRAGFDGPYLLFWVINDARGGVLALSASPTQAYLATDFERPPVMIVPPLTAEGVDLNGNSLYDVLRVNFSVDVQSEGVYAANVWVYDDTNAYSELGYDQMPYAVGITERSFDFNGWKISGLGVPGPYFVQVAIQDADSNVVAQTSWSVDPPLDPATFEPAPAVFSAPDDVYLTDADGDGLANFISVDVPIQVNHGGELFFFASLCATPTGPCLSWDDADYILGPGPATAHFDFSTIPFAVQALNGPYSIEVEMDFFVDMWNYTVIGTETVPTPGFLASQFDPAPASLGSTVAGTAVDRDLDGTMDVFRVAMEVDVQEPGLYWFLAGMTTDLGWARAPSVYRYLEAGIQKVAIDFPGAQVACESFGGSCPVSVSMGVLAGGNIVRYAGGSYAVGPPSGTVFDSAIRASLSGTVLGAPNGAPVGDLFLYAYNYETEDRVSGGTDTLGHYSLSLYEGTWVLRTFDIYYRYADTLTWVQVSAPSTRADVSLPLGVPDDRTNDVSFSSWSAATQTRTWTFAGRPTTRQEDDWSYGNRDGYLNLTEFNATRHWPGTLPPAVSATSAESFLVDGQALGLVPDSSSFAFDHVEGTIDDPTPMGGVETASYAGSAAASDQSHTVSVLVQWAFPWYTWHYRVALPGGFVASSVQAPPGVEVSGLGTALVTLAAGLDPDSTDGLTSVWVVITAVPTGPTLTDVTAQPDPAARGSPVTIVARAGYAAGPVDVRVEVRDPRGKSLGTFPMAYNAGSGLYEYTGTFRNQGTYTYTVTVTDGLGRQASASGAFVIRKATKGGSPSASTGIWV